MNFGVGFLKNSCNLNSGGNEMKIGVMSDTNEKFTLF